MDLLPGAAAARPADARALCHPPPPLHLPLRPGDDGARARHSARNGGRSAAAQTPLTESAMTLLFLVLFIGLLAAGMPIFLVLGTCAGVLYYVSGQPLIGLAPGGVNDPQSGEHNA